MLKDALTYFQNNMKQPWGVLMYKMAWAQLNDAIEMKGLKVLDFGSGLGTTANFFAADNEVIAIEPDADLIEERERENDYIQIHGTVAGLQDFANGYFDVVICHNVLEYASERAEIVREFSRVLKKGGILSVIKHEKAGRIIGTVVYDYNTDEALNLLNGKNSSNSFGCINYYNPEDLAAWGESIGITKVLGLISFGRLQQNENLKLEPGWVNKMFEVEMKVCDLEPYKSMAWFNHILLKKEI